MWRYEYKIVVNNFTLEELKELVILHPKHFIEKYPVRRVNNIYFDTADLSNYNDSLSGCARRSKMRFRWYGESLSRVKGNLELKKKKGMLIAKETQVIGNEFNLDEHSWKDITTSMAESITGSIKNDFYYTFVPVIINSYYRYYYETCDSSCRITIDYNQKVYDQRIYSRPNTYFYNPLSPSLILEIKSDYNSEAELGQIANYFPFRISQNSKYTSGIFWI